MIDYEILGKFLLGQFTDKRLEGEIKDKVESLIYSQIQRKLEEITTFEFGLESSPREVIPHLKPGHMNKDDFDEYMMDYFSFSLDEEEEDEYLITLVYDQKNKEILQYSFPIMKRDEIIQDFLHETAFNFLLKWFPQIRRI